MPFPRIKGHDAILDRFRRALVSGRLPSTFLFVGPRGIGKRTFAVRLAAALFCRRRNELQLDPCGECPDCQQVLAGSHPDFEEIAKPPDKNFIPIELLIGNREHRGREGLCHRLSLKPARGHRKLAIIDDADYLNVEGVNCLLKTLEEPFAGSVLILIVTSLSRQLPTLRSRCQIVRFRPLASEIVAELLIEQGVCVDRSVAARWAEASGSVSVAMSRVAEDQSEFCSELRDTLRQGSFDSVALAAALTKHVNEAGQDPSKRRQAFRQVLAAAAGVYRQLMFELCGAASVHAVPSTNLLNASSSTWPGGPESAAACVEYCLETEVRLDSNANLATLMECWSDDLTGIVDGRTPYREVGMFWS